MKLFKISLLAIISLILSCKDKPENTIITGKVMGDFPKKVQYTIPTNNTSYLGFRETVTTDSLGQYKISLPIEKVSFVKIIIPKEDGLFQITNAALVVEPRKKYEVNFNLDAPDKTYDINAENQIAQYTLNQLPNPEHPEIGAIPFYRDSITTNITATIDSLQNVDIKKMKALYEKDSLSSSFFDLVKLDRTYYYTALKGTVAFVKFIMNEREKGVFTDEVKTMWQSCFDNDLLSRPDFQNTFWGFSLLENYLYYKRYEAVDFDAEKFKTSTKDVPYISHRISEAKKYLPKDRLEFYEAAFLYRELLQKNYQKEFISLYNEFGFAYPSSSYSQYLEPLIDSVVDFHKKAEQQFSKDVKFVNNYTEINTFSDLLAQFKGKKIYIDIWGTWCGPCKKEFQHKNDLKKLLKSKNIETLYICEGRSSKENNWKNMIKFYDLEGYHIMANEKLLADIIKIFGNNGSFYYPRYILIDANGKTIKSTAAKPSELSALKQQIEEAF
ncbi:TlpA family protein disulfide reductase [Aestuariivivens marinum]|uniref:TlpA family protein disulfide reductase n=1 Tax=Aestuariivivens marinum TaxID=2913555 RepID=UPI001F58B4FE|nr:TlpA disulfide reductase family protein [Aestuariivivens marinum]